MSANTSVTGDLGSFGTWVTQQHAAGVFSGVVLVARDACQVFQMAVGLADRASGVANTIETR